MKVYKTNTQTNIHFQEETVEKGNHWSGAEGGVINIFDEVEYQEVLGFGGAFTESAAYNYSLMDDKTKERFMKAYFDDEEGIAYNFGRTHINSCDFAVDIYNYVQDGDKTLETFDISRDKKYIIPFLKDALKYAKEDIFLFASPWSPPAYMKDNNSVLKGGKVLEEYKETWALYYAKYIKAYKEEGIDIKAISIQNEPNARQTWESCSYTAEDEADFIEKYIIPVFDREGLSDIKIIIWDHNKERVYDRAKKTLSNPKVNEKVWAVGHHWYSGDHFDGLRIVYEQLKKPLISSENCGSIKEKVQDGGLNLAERYGKEIAENFNNYDIAYCDWNLMLNQNGGPYHNRTATTNAIPGVVFDDVEGGCFAPILYDADKNSIELTPVYYYIGHFSKFVKKGAKRIAYSKYTDDLTVGAFKNPDGEIVVVVMNTSDIQLPAIIRNNDTCTKVDIEAHSIATIKFNV